MTQEFAQDIEQVLLQGAIRFKQGDSSAVDDIVTALKRVESRHGNLQPILSALLKLEDGDIQVFAACALANLGSGARDAVPALKELMQANIPAASGAAASALGVIPGRASVEALGSVLKTMDAHTAYFVFSAIKRHADEAGILLPELVAQRQNSGLDSSSKYSLSHCIQAIRCAERYRYQQTLKALELHEYIPVGRMIGDEHAAQYYARFGPERLSDEHGLILNGRFRFQSYGQENSECGLKIYRGASGEDLVMVSHDSKAYGTSPTNCAESLATAIVAMYGLNPQKLIWVERYSPTSGLMDEQESKRVSFRYNPQNGRFSDPSWTQLQGAKSFLRQFGIE